MNQHAVNYEVDWGQESSSYGKSQAEVCGKGEEAHQEEGKATTKAMLARFLVCSGRAGKWRGCQRGKERFLWT